MTDASIKVALIICAKRRLIVPVTQSCCPIVVAGAPMHMHVNGSAPSLSGPSAPEQHNSRKNQFISLPNAFAGVSPLFGSGNLRGKGFVASGNVAAPGSCQRCWISLICSTNGMLAAASVNMFSECAAHSLYFRENVPLAPIAPSACLIDSLELANLCPMFVETCNMRFKIGFKPSMACVFVRSILQTADTKRCTYAPSSPLNAHRSISCSKRMKKFEVVISMYFLSRANTSRQTTYLSLQ